MRWSRAFWAGAVAVPLALGSAFSAGFVLAEGQKTAANEAGLVAARELIVATGAARQFETVVPMMVKQLEPILNQVAPGKEAEMREILTLMTERFSARKGEMLEVIAGIYSAKLTETEIRDLTKFFSQGVGAVFIAKQPEIVAESMTAGQKWGEKIGVEIEQEIKRELTKRGIKI